MDNHRSADNSVPTIAAGGRSWNIARRPLADGRIAGAGVAAAGCHRCANVVAVDCVDSVAPVAEASTAAVGVDSDVVAVDAVVAPPGTAEADNPVHHQLAADVTASSDRAVVFRAVAVAAAVVQLQLQLQWWPQLWLPFWRNPLEPVSP